jgi:hypothetical protein
MEKGIDEEQELIEAIHSFSVHSNSSSGKGLSPRNSFSSIPNRGINRFSKRNTRTSSIIRQNGETDFVVLNIDEKEYSNEESANLESALKVKGSRFSSSVKSRPQSAHQSLKKVNSLNIFDSKRKGSSSSSIGKESAEARFRKFKKGEIDKTKLAPVLKKVESDGSEYKFILEFITPSYDELSKGSESSNSSEFDSKASTPSPTPECPEQNDSTKRKIMKEKKKIIRARASDPKELIGAKVELDRLAMKEIAKTDLIQSEELYFKQLGILLNEYLCNIEVSKDEVKLSSREVSILQSNVEDLYTFHKSCMEEVEKDQSKIAEFFLSRIGFLKSYMHYLNGFAQLINVLSSHSGNAEFNSFLQHLRTKSAISSLSFITLLKIPLDRVPYYEASFRELKRFSLPQDSDFIMLQQVYDKIQRTSSFISENISEFEQLLYLMDIDYGLKNKQLSGFNLISNHRIVLSKQKLLLDFNL